MWAATVFGSTTAFSMSAPANARIAASDCHRVSTRNLTLSSSSRRLNCAPAKLGSKRSSGTTLWQAALLCPRSERPRRRVSEERDELAPGHAEHRASSLGVGHRYLPHAQPVAEA